MPFTNVKGILLDYGNTLIPAPPDSDLVAELRARIVPLLVDNAPPGGLLTLAERVLHDIADRLLTPAIDDSLVEHDLAAIVKQVFESSDAWAPDGLLEVGLGLADGALADYMWEGRALSAETRQALRNLRRSGYDLAIVSNSWFRRDWLGDTPLRGPDDDLMDAVILSSEVGHRKPHPSMFHAAFDALGIAAHETLFVGDSLESDIRGAKAAGIPYAVLSHEFRQEDDSQGEADAVIKSLSELVDLL